MDVGADRGSPRSHELLPGTPDRGRSRHNLESVIEAIRSCGELELELIARALRKELNARDALLSKVGHDAARRHIRDCVRKAMRSSVDVIVERLKAALG